MTQRLRVDVQISALAAHQGGRSGALRSGYRPLCVFKGERPRVTVGLCELEAETPIEPGTSGRATLIFDDLVATEARRLAKEGVAFELAEGDRVVATARVISAG